MKYIDANLIQV